MNRTIHSLLALLLIACWSLPAQSQNTENTEAEQADEVDREESKPKKQKEREFKPLTIGSPAPALDIEHWVQNGDGEFTEVTEFEENKVYVVEFWATWCGPCISSMPHIVEIQDKYADRDVQIISISDEDLETVEEFLDGDVRGSEDGATYRDLTRSYCLTTDPDRSSSRNYMRAAGQNGIPCAFVVGKKGHVEWIGHPMSMDDVLEQVVNDQWDRESYAEEYVAEQEAKKLNARLSRLLRAKELDKAMELLDESIADEKFKLQKQQLREIKFQILIRDEERAGDAAEYAVELLSDDVYDPSSANNLAWKIYQMADRGMYVDDRVTKAALQLAKSKVKEAGDLQAYLLDTVAHLQHQLGDSRQALKTQRRAHKLANAVQKEELIEFLQELEELVEPKKEKKSEPDEQEAEAETDSEPAEQP